MQFSNATDYHHRACRGTVVLGWKETDIASTGSISCQFVNNSTKTEQHWKCWCSVNHTQKHGPTIKKTRGRITNPGNAESGVIHWKDFALEDTIIGFRSGAILPSTLVRGGSQLSLWDTWVETESSLMECWKKRCEWFVRSVLAFLLTCARRHTRKTETYTRWLLDLLSSRVDKSEQFLHISILCNQTKPCAG